MMRLLEAEVMYPLGIMETQPANITLGDDCFKLSCTFRLEKDGVRREEEEE